MTKTNTIFLYNDNIGAVSLVDHMGTDLSVVNAARVSFGVEKAEFDKKDAQLIRYLAKHHHTSPFEHVVATFKFTVPLFVRSQHHRHRTFSFNEISRRYTADNLQFYLPSEFRTQHENNRQASNDTDLINPIMSRYHEGHPPDGLSAVPGEEYGWYEDITASDLMIEHAQKSIEFFDWLIMKGVAREQARMVLPQNLYTEYYGTVDLHNLVKFINLRSHEGAQWEIRKVADAVLTLASELWPISIKAFKEVGSLSDG